MKSLRSGLKNARGMGAAHAGTHHFWVQRMTALALIPLSIWFIVNLSLLLVGSNPMVVIEWMRHPIHALMMALFIIALFWHARLGLQVIIEDYVHSDDRKFALLIFSSAVSVILCAVALMAIARIHFFSM